jgi:hypothetical protein
VVKICCGGFLLLAVSNRAFSLAAAQENDYICHSNFLGRLAQLVERLVYTEDVGSSSLSPPTIFPALSGGAFQWKLKP